MSSKASAFFQRTAGGAGASSKGGTPVRALQTLCKLAGSTAPATSLQIHDGLP